MATSDEKVMSVIRVEASDKRSCDAIIRTRVDAGKVDDVSKKITTTYNIRRRRLGGGGAGAEISAGASEEEVKVGDEPKWTDFSSLDNTPSPNKDSSDSSPSPNTVVGSEDDDDENDDSGDFQTFLNSSGMLLESNLVAVILAMLLGMFATML